MDVSDLNRIFNAQLTPADFQRLSNFIYNEYGIKMPPEKKVMLQSRLQKRLRALGIASYKDYIDFVFSKEGQQSELYHMIDAVSTNKTDFFREPVHFDLLRDLILPEFTHHHQAHARIKVWSAGCSSGEEVYTMAMVLHEFGLLNPIFDYYIFGSDISVRMLQAAATAVYPEEKIEVIPTTLKKKYFLRNKDTLKKTVRVVPLLRNKVKFGRLNFMDKTYQLNETFDIIFCRNVLIYFDRQTQEEVINKLCTKLKPGGYFFLGHSESIMNMKLPLVQVKPTVFRRT